MPIQPPQAPRLPEAPAPQTPGLPAPVGTPRVGADYPALKARLNEYVAQLRSAERRRESVSREIMQTGDGPNRQALVQRLAGIDKQILQLDADITETGRLVAQAAPPQATFPSTAPPPSSNDEGPIIVMSVFTIFVLAPIAFAFARRLWKRPVALPAGAAWTETPGRLERLENAVDTIAVEIERVSESQRFMTRLMTETQLGSTVASVRASADAARDAVAEPMDPPPLKALGVGEKPFEPIKVAERDELRIRRDA